MVISGLLSFFNFCYLGKHTHNNIRHTRGRRVLANNNHFVWMFVYALKRTTFVNTAKKKYAITLFVWRRYVCKIFIPSFAVRFFNDFSAHVRHSFARYACCISFTKVTIFAKRLSECAILYFVAVVIRLLNAFDTFCFF